MVILAIVAASPGFTPLVSMYKYEPEPPWPTLGPVLLELGVAELNLPAALCDKRLHKLLSKLQTLLVGAAVGVGEREHKPHEARQNVGQRFCLNLLRLCRDVCRSTKGLP